MYTEVPKIVVKPDATPLEFFRAVYTNNDAPLNVRMKAASEAKELVHPRLAAIATYATGESFADHLEQRRLARAKVISAQPVEGSKPPLGPSPEEVSAERMGKSFSSLRRRV